MSPKDVNCVTSPCAVAMHKEGTVRVHHRIGRLMVVPLALIAAAACVPPPTGPGGPVVYPDRDRDGYTADVDCRDDDPAINPGETDTYGDDVDRNCDGVDGVVTDSVFVKGSTGQDLPTCGPINQPCRTIQQGQSRAIELSRPHVRIAGGTYARFELAGGIFVEGGYGQNFRKGRYATPPATTEVQASFDPAVGGPWAVSGRGLDGSTSLEDVILRGVAAPAGAPSYTLRLERSSFVGIRNVTIHGGIGGAGTAGANGTNAAARTPNMNGAVGGNSHEDGAFCDDHTSGQAGAGGTQLSSSASNGAPGGPGGYEDTYCGGWSNYDATGGTVGGGTYGGAGGRPASDDCETNPYGRGNGKAENGQPGAAGDAGREGIGGIGAAANAGQVVGTQWLPLIEFLTGNGTPGFLGYGGAGGAGGGGGGASDCSDDDWGGGGGGGGAGGLPAPVAGRGGTVGAASIAVLLVDSMPNMDNVDVVMGTGGAGGRGGNGGTGQAGGTGGAGGLPDCNSDGGAFGFCTPTGHGGGGGRGGDGGRGGHSGAGGGGAGGPAVGIWMGGAAGWFGTVSNSGGTGGVGGVGGGGPVAGNAGLTGPVRWTVEP